MIGVLVALFIVIIIFVCLIIWWRSGQLKVILDPQYVPTAEYLLQNPWPTPEAFTIWPPVGEFVHEGDEICINGSDRSYWAWSHLLINGSRLAAADLDIVFHDVYPNQFVQFCFPNESGNDSSLKSGVHLLEIRLRTSPFSTRYSYEWAIRVVPDEDTDN